MNNMNGMMGRGGMPSRGELAISGQSRLRSSINITKDLTAACEAVWVAKAGTSTLNSLPVAEAGEASTTKATALGQNGTEWTRTPNPDAQRHIFPSHTLFSRHRFIRIQNPWTVVSSLDTRALGEYLVCCGPVSCFNNAGLILFTRSLGCDMSFSNVSESVLGLDAASGPLWPLTMFVRPSMVRANGSAIEQPTQCSATA